MSMAEDFGYDAYDKEDIRKWRERNNYPKDKDGKRHCKDCGSDNVKTSQKGNLYCGELCWTKKEAQLEGAAGVLANGKQGVRTEVKRKDGGTQHGV